MSVENLTGRTLGQYELHDLLGVGGMGAVYRAHQSALGRDVAVKVLPGTLAREPGYAERFTREARIAASLEHPHIVPIYDYGTQDGISYVVMRLLNDGTLAQRLYARQQRRESLPSLAETADLLRQVASALDYAHRKGVVHRDMKPGNIMFDDGTPYIVDFGIARLMNAASITGEQQVFGTPMYMPPEQWRDEELTPETDQYALAAVTYTLITGQLLFAAAQPQQLMFKHLNELPTSPSAIRADIPTAASDVIGRALAKSPRDRFLTASAFAQAFSAAVAGKAGEYTGFFTFPMDNAPVEPDEPYNVSQPMPQAPEDRIPKGVNAPPLTPVKRRDSTPATMKSTPRVEENPGAPLEPMLRSGATTPPPRPESLPPRIVNDPPPAPLLPDRYIFPPPRTRQSSPVRSLLLGGGIGLALLAVMVCAGLAFVANQFGLFDSPVNEVISTRTLEAQSDFTLPTALPEAQATPITPQFLEPVPTGLPVSASGDASGTTLLGTLSQGTDTVRALDFSPDGGTLATGGGGDGVVHLWDVGSQTERGQFDAGGVVNDIRYSRDGTRIAASNENGQVVLYDVGAGQILTVWQAHDAPVRGLDFSPDGSRLVTTSEDQSAVVWDTQTEARLFMMSSHTGDVLDAAYSPDGTRIATGGRDTLIRLWDAATGVEIQVLSGHTDEVRSVTYSPDGTQIASGSLDGTIRLWDAASGALQQTLTGHNNGVWSVEYSPDGSLIISGGRDNTAKVWDVATGAMIVTLTGHTGWVIGVDFSPDGLLIATGSGDGTARLWDMSSG